MISFLVLYPSVSSLPFPYPSPFSSTSTQWCCAVCQKTEWVDYCIMSFVYMFMKWGISLRRDVHTSVVIGSSVYPRKGDEWLHLWVASVRKLNVLFLWAVSWNSKCVLWWTSGSACSSPCGQFSRPHGRDTGVMTWSPHIEAIFISTWSKDCILHLL